MFYSAYLRRFLHEKGQLHPYRACIQGPDEPSCQVVDEHLYGPDQALEQAPVFEKWHSCADREKNSAALWLKYPGGYFVCIHFRAYAVFTSEELETLHHILYPCYTDRIVKSLNDRLQLLSIRNEVLTRLTALSVANSGMEKIVEELRGLLHKPLVFVNLATGEQLPAGEKLPANLDMGKLALLFSQQKEPKYMEFPSPEQGSNYIFPILSSGICLGCYIVAAEQPLLPLDLMIVEQGATIAAIELLKSQSLTELYYRKAYQIFDELIHTNDPSALIDKCNELSIDFNANYVACVFAFTTNIDLQILEMCVLRLIASLKKELAGIYQTVFCFENKVTLLASVKKEGHLPDLTNRLKAIIKATQKRENILLSAGMGSLYKGAGHIGKSFIEANKALSYQVSHHNPSLIAYCDIGINRLFLNLPQEEAETYVKEVFEPLRMLSKGQNSNLEDTLLTYMETNCSIGKTAERLYIHVNTLYQRLNKIEEHLKVSFRDSDDLLRIQLACYLKRHHTQSLSDYADT